MWNLFLINYYNNFIPHSNIENHFIVTENTLVLPKLEYSNILIKFER